MSKHEGIRITRPLEVDKLKGSPGKQARDAIERENVPVMGEKLKGFPAFRCSAINVSLYADGIAKLECVYTEHIKTGQA